MKRKKLVGLVTLALVGTLTLMACGSNSDEKTKGSNQETATEDVSKFPIVTSNKEKSIEGGILEVAMISDSPFKGLFLTELYQDGYDAKYMGPAVEGLFSSDKDFLVTDEGPAKLDLDLDKKQATITIQKEVKWSDGEPLKAEDIIYAYEIIGNKDYTGVRYDAEMMNIVGMEDYHAGKSETITGIKAVDDKTVTIAYKEMDPGMQSAGGIWSSAAPKHVLKDIPIKDLESSDPVRKNPVTFGPYKFSNIVPGEKVEFEPNEYYYGEKPKLAKIVFENLAPASAVEAMKAKKYDVFLSMVTDTYPTYKDIEGYEILAREELAYTYLGFKLGKWNEKEERVEMNPDAKMGDKALRQAMGYAVNNDQVAEKFYNGLRSNATTLIPPIFKELHNKEVKGYTQDQEKAKKLLADAGYKDTDSDGFVETPEGKPLVIKFASMSGSETAQPLADYYIQEWEKIGLNVELTTGRLIDFQSFYDKLKSDDPEIDIFQGAWGVASNPSPTGLYGATSAFNYSRFQSEENDTLLANIDSNKSFDKEYRKKAFDDWQAYAFEEAFVIPTLYRNEVLPVSTRVINLDWHPETYNYWADIGVSSEKR